MGDVLAILFLCTVGAAFLALIAWNVFLFFKVGIPSYRKLRGWLKESER